MPSMTFRPVFGLADVNSMYCSTHRVFRPDLWKVPLVALSNNDDCVIAQTSEVKALGIEMAQPWFQVEEKARQLGVIPFSSHYELYADFSNRFVQTLRHFTPRLEVYSIDECFLDLTGMKRDLKAYGHEIKDTVLEWTKLPICVGVGHSKTLAKLANKVAKKQQVFKGVCDFTSMSDQDIDNILEQLDLKSVWGVGESYKKRLQGLGVNNVLRLKRANPKRVRDEFGVVLERTVCELNGEPWLEISQAVPQAKQIMSSRSFGERVTTYKGMQEAVTFHATNASGRLRKKDLYTNMVHCFIQSSPFDKPPFHDHLTLALPAPTNCTIKINNAVSWMLKQIYVPGIRYQKVGVMLMELMPAAGQQTDLFGFSHSKPKSKSLMQAMDNLNTRYGRGTVHLASEGIKKSWAMRRNMMSPNYTGDWKQLPVIGQPYVSS